MVTRSLAVIFFPASTQPRCTQPLPYVAIQTPPYINGTHTAIQQKRLPLLAFRHAGEPP